MEKRVKKFGQGPPPPFSGNARKKTFIFTGGVPLQDTKLQQAWLAIYIGKKQQDINNSICRCLCVVLRVGLLCLLRSGRSENVSIISLGPEGICVYQESPFVLGVTPSPSFIDTAPVTNIDFKKELFLCITLWEAYPYPLKTSCPLKISTPKKYSPPKIIHPPKNIHFQFG